MEESLYDFDIKLSCGISDVRCTDNLDAFHIVEGNRRSIIVCRDTLERPEYWPSTLQPGLFGEPSQPVETGTSLNHFYDDLAAILAREVLLVGPIYMDCFGTTPMKTFDFQGNDFGRVTYSRRFVQCHVLALHYALQSTFNAVNIVMLGIGQCLPLLLDKYIIKPCPRNPRRRL